MVMKTMFDIYIAEKEKVAWLKMHNYITEEQYFEKLKEIERLYGY